MHLVGAVGQDFAGERLIETLERKSVDVSGVITVPAWSTSQEMRIMARGQHILRIAREESVPFRPGDEHRLGGLCQEAREGRFREHLFRIWERALFRSGSGRRR